MKIAFDHQIFTYQKYGGISRYFTILASNLIKQSQDVRILTCMHRNNYISNMSENIATGIKLNDYPPKSTRFFEWLNHGISELKAKTWKPNIVHETYYSSLPISSTKAARFITVYDMIHELYSEQFSAKDKTTERKKKAFDRVDHIISISHNTKSDLINIFGIDESKISVIHLGVNIDAFQISKNQTIFSNQQYILYVGARSGYKNFKGVLEACSKSKIIKNKIKIIAFGGGSFNKNELQRIYELGFNEGMVEQISGDDQLLSILYTNALCFVYPSLYEGFGLPPLEAMAAKCPVVSSNTSSMPEVINQAGIYFDPLNTDEIIFTLERVITDSNLRSNLIQQGLKNIQKFTWEKCAIQTLQSYKNHS